MHRFERIMGHHQWIQCHHPLDRRTGAKVSSSKRLFEESVGIQPHTISMLKHSRFTTTQNESQNWDIALHHWLGRLPTVLFWWIWPTCVGILVCPPPT
mmetsp:Transcript_31350/g.31622  ORF Transcript_31350/g.31622 Transcript_31350/m.31622 type:complete len:98 (-) Transcript_31350:335-628(-)